MSNLTGTDKSVILLMTIGEDRAAEVFKHLSQREVQTLSAAMANVTQISNKQLTDVLAEFEQEAEQFAALNINANDYLRSVLVKALGEERAASLLEDILETRDTASGIETLNFMEPQSAADLIRDEHPQIIATILVHLKRAQAADILALFDERLRHDVMLRIATFGGVQPAALAELTEVLNGLLDGQNLKRSKMGGVRTAAEIINLMKTQQEEAVITAVREFDGELAQKIIDEMFLFENLVDVDDRSIQRLLQEVDSESLLIALKGAEQPLREKFLRNMSQRAADILRDDLANRGPVRLSQVENEQKAILLIVRRLAETGEIVAQNIGGTLRHIAQEFLAQWLLGPFQRDQQRFGIHFLQQTLNAAIVDIHQIFEQEHLVDNFLRQLAVEFAHGGNNGFFLLSFHQVDNFGCCSHAAHFAALEILTVEQAIQYFGQFRQRGWLHAAKGGDTQHHVVAQTFIEQRQNIGGLRALQMHQNGGDNLRMLIANQIGGALRLHKVERFNTAGGIASFENIFQQAGGTFFTQSFDQYRTQIIVGVDIQCGKLFSFLLKFRQHIG